MQSKTKQLTAVRQNRVASRRLAWLLLLSALSLIVIWLGLKTWHIVRAAQSLQARQAEVEALMANGPTAVDPEQAEALVLGVRRDVFTLKTEVEPFLPLTPYLGWLPKVGPTIVVAPQLLQMADAGTEAAAYAIRGLKPALTVIQDEDPSADSRIPELVQVLDAAEPDLVQAGLALERVMAARAELGDTEALPWRVRTLLERVDQWLPLGHDGLKMALVLPEMMGSAGPRRYLIIAQNEDELRATGGFISGAGLMVVENGRIIDLSFQDSYDIDNWREKPYDFPPQPLYDYMLLELFLFRDANFWPDFPTSAEAAMELYSYSRDVPPVDGAIAIDQRFVQLLVEATGPVHIAEAGVTLNSKNVIDNFRQAWAIQEDQEVGEWFGDRKAFLGTFASAIKTRLESDFSSIDPILFTQNLYQAVQSKHLQIYMRDPAVAAVLDEIDWDGRLQNTAGQDYLAVIDTNMGFNKSNVFIEKETDYHVTLTSEGNADAELTVNYTHTGTDSDQTCQQGVLYSYDEVTDYLKIADKCYWNYLRVYAPEGSQLIESSEHIVPADTLLGTETWQGSANSLNELASFTTFANFLMVSRAESVSSHYRYQLPSSVVQTIADGDSYHLTIAKQAGARPQPLTVTVTLPGNAHLLEATPAPTAVKGTTVVFELNMETDTSITVTYR